MPFMDGLECMRRLRAREGGAGRRRTFSVAVSANGDDDEFCGQCLDAGFDRATAKPLLPDKLLELLRYAKEYAAAMTDSPARTSSNCSGVILPPDR